MRKMIAAGFLSSLCLAMTAQTVETVYTKTGDVYEGFVSEQIPGVQISVFAEKATIAIDAAAVTNRRDDDRPFSSLTPVAKAWFRERGDTVSVRLSSFEWQKESIDNVFIIENGPKIKYISFAAKNYKLPFSVVEKIVKPFDAESPYGLRDKVTLKDGDQLVGGIVEQLVGVKMTIKTIDGTDRDVPVRDVLSVRSEAIDQNTDIWRQTLLLDRLYLSDGTVLEGMIISRVMGEKVILRQAESPVEHVVPMKAIKKYQKYWNKHYEEYVAPVIDTACRVWLDGNEIALTPVFGNDEKYFASDSLIVMQKAGESFSVEVQNMACDPSLRVYRAERVRYTDKDDQEHYGNYYLVVKRGADPVNEFPFIRDEKHNVSTAIICRAGYYILSIDGFESVLALDVKS